jgi:cytochrome c-type biogenesis protein CcsB
VTTLFNVSFTAYLLALLVSVFALFSKRRLVDVTGIGLLAAGALVQTVYMLVRWSEAGRAPFSNMFESLVLFAWAIAVVYIVLSIKIRVRALAAATALITVVTLAYASAFESDIRPLMPALQSNWLSVHVFSCLLGYAGFAISFLSAIIFLVAARERSKATKEIRDAMEETTDKTIAFGFLFLAIGIITGAVWANSAWGTYWSWDPKETWSLITWFVYAIYLHCRYMRGWRGKRAAWIAIVGFISILFTYIGVNFLLSGLHSYA